MKRWLTLVNPRAGTTATPAHTVRDVLRAHGIEADIVQPESPQQAVEVIQREAHEGRTHFSLVGGDGTVNLVANALLELGLDFRPTIGVLPAGTGCDLLRTFGLPQDLWGAAKHLTTDSTYEIDVVALEGDWGDKYYVNVAQVGAGAAAAETAPKFSRRFGSFRYPLAFAARLARFPRAHVTITTESRVYESDALAVIMANAQFFAGGWNVAPKATLVDGVVDMQVFDAKKTQAPAIVPKLIKGTHLSDPAVRRFTAAEFRIESQPIWPLEADGDLIGNTAVHGRVVPAAIRLKI